MCPGCPRPAAPNQPCVAVDATSDDLGGGSPHPPRQLVSWSRVVPAPGPLVSTGALRGRAPRTDPSHAVGGATSGRLDLIPRAGSAAAATGAERARTRSRCDRVPTHGPLRSGAAPRTRRPSDLRQPPGPPATSPASRAGARRPAAENPPAADRITSGNASRCRRHAPERPREERRHDPSQGLEDAHERRGVHFDRCESAGGRRH
jgi:hypothetical protein